MFGKNIISLLCICICTGGYAQVDLSGTWDNGSGIGFLQPVAIGDSICVVACSEATQAEPSSNSGVRAAPARPVYKLEFQTIVDRLNRDQVKEDPVLRCQPPGLPRIGPPDKIIQTDDEIVFLYDDVSGNFFRVIPIGDQGHKNNLEASFLGDAIGYWEDDTLVVETVNFNDQTWLTDDGAFHTDKLRVVERLSRDNNELMWDVMVYDTDILAEPWHLPLRIASLSETEIVEAPLCIERDLEHIVDGSSHDNVR